MVPWAQLLALIEPVARRNERGRPPLDIEVMLRIHFLQRWFELSDVAMEERRCSTCRCTGSSRAWAG